MSRSKIADVMTADVVQHIPIEEPRTEKTYVEPDREPYEAERRESTLVQSLAMHLRRRDHEVCRLQIVPKGEYKPLFTDLYDVTADILVETKGITRETIRMAIGQLADYSRFVPSGAESDSVDLAPPVRILRTWHVDRASTSSGRTGERLRLDQLVVGLAACAGFGQRFGQPAPF